MHHLPRTLQLSRHGLEASFVPKIGRARAHWLSVDEGGIATLAWVGVSVPGSSSSDGRGHGGAIVECSQCTCKGAAGASGGSSRTRKRFA